MEKPHPIMSTRRVTLPEYDAFVGGEVVNYFGTTYRLTVQAEGKWSAICRRGYRHFGIFSRDMVVRGLLWTDSLPPAPLDTLFVVRYVGGERYCSNSAELKEVVKEVRETTTGLYTVFHRPNGFRTLYIRSPKGKWTTYYNGGADGWLCAVCGKLVEPVRGLEQWMPMEAPIHTECLGKIL